MTAVHRLTEEQRINFLRYTRTRQWPMFQRFPVAEDLHIELLAQMLACSPGHVRALVDRLRDTARATASRMLAHDRHRAAIAALPFSPGDRIVAVGDSITADRIGWFELLAASIDLAGGPHATLHNLGVSGNTTADVLERFDRLEAARPTHVLLMLGTNDARAHGRTGSYRMATERETERNLRALIDLVANDLSAAVTVITPPAVDQDRIAASFAGLPIRWQATTVAEVAAVVRKVAPDGIDLHSATLAYGVDALLESDGVHPTLAGQQFILTEIVAHLGPRT